MPDFRHEIRIGGIVAGVDEVGRGPLAGPVVAAAAILPPALPESVVCLIDDSKKLSAARRVLALNHMIAAGAVIAIGAASVTEIGRINILQASLLAMRRALIRLPYPPDHVLVDGTIMPGIEIPCTTLIGGDGVSLSIAAASIAAKIARDRLMRRLDGRYPGYGWSRNAGYGTAVHRGAIVSMGATAHHRIGFGPLLRVVETQARQA